MDRPILFNGEMVRAILEGRKTQTRRVMKLKYRENEAGFQILVENSTGKFAYAEYYDDDENPTRMIEAPCHPDDILWVRETWAKIPHYVYKADDEQPEFWDYDDRWHPSIHMPKEAARIFLRVKDVQVERIQDISASDCVAEGVEISSLTNVGQDFCKGLFSSIWDSTIKPADRERYGWEANPWVWVIEFERIDKPDGWCGIRTEKPANVCG